MSIRRGNNIIAGAGGSGSEEDNLTITKNSDGLIQTVGAINKNTATSATGVVYDWVGTLAEWQDQQIATLHPDWIWYITDDVSGGDGVYTKTEVNNLLNNKQNTLTAGSNITIVDDVISSTGGIDKIDNISITKNTDDEIQAEGTLNKNVSSSQTGVYNWVGTLSEYKEQDIENTHPEWTCYITDDESSSIILNNRNIGDIFFTCRKDDSVNGAVECNGATYSIDDYEGSGSIGELLEAGKLDYISLTAYATAISTKGWCDKIGWDGTGTTAFRVPAISPKHYIIKSQEPTAGNNYTWYRLYADGWVEQGGVVSVSVSANTDTAWNKNLPVAMRDNEYTLLTSIKSGWINTTTGGAEGKSTTGISGYCKSSNTQTIQIHWQVSGVSNITPESASRVMFQLFNGVTDEAVANYTGILTDVSNLNETTLRTNQISNCITEIPQDIKLELNNGTLTLKAGSKVYVPRTNNEFFEVIITDDLTYSYSDASFTSSLFYDLSTNTIFGETTTGSGSGTNPPQPYYTYYNTSQNVIRRSINGTTWLGDEMSLPLAIIKSTQGIGITSIDQVFNGFGYIGSTIFTLPGVKGLIPNGRNADGSLNNIEISIDTVKTANLPSYMASRKDAPLCIFSDGRFDNFDTNYFSWGTVKKYSDINKKSYSCYYCIEDNIIYYYNETAAESVTLRAFIGSMNIDENNKITSFTSKTAFHALDYNDTQYIAHNAMPSNRYVDLTLGASGTQYTAPADGYVYVNKKSTAQGQYLQINFHNMVAIQIAVGNGNTLRVCVMVSKGTNFSVSYNAEGTTEVFRFIYANGAQ